MFSQVLIDSVVTSILAVNKFPILKVQDLLPRMREARLLDPAFVAEQELGALTVQLYNSGYDRGMLTSRLAERLLALMKSIERGELARLEAFVREGKKEQATALLLQVWGIGPTVARTAWALMSAALTRA